jgi:hypothetical protein
MIRRCDRHAVGVAAPIAVASESIRAPRAGRCRTLRVALGDGRSTTVHVACHDARGTDARVVVLPPATRLADWSARHGVAEALIGGFFTRPGGTPLGEVRTGGVERRHVPFAAPWGAVRSCVHVEAGTVRIAARDALPPAPRGDLLQAGPLLVARGTAVYDRAGDPEGFSAGAAQFDSDITLGREPRAALGLDGDRLLAVVCDGRSRRDAGLTLAELARVMAALGAETALNLDGGGSASLISGGRLRNRPRRDFELTEPGGRAVATALAFLPLRRAPSATVGGRCRPDRSDLAP